MENKNLCRLCGNEVIEFFDNSQNFYCDTCYEALSEVPCRKINAEISDTAEEFIQLISDKLKPEEYGEEPYYLEVGIMTDGAIVAIFTPL